MSRLVRCRTAVLSAAAVLSLLTGCGGEDPPARFDDPGGPVCEDEGTGRAAPASTLRGAVQPYLEPGQTLRIAERFGDTAEVHIGRRGDGGSTVTVVKLVRTEPGWVTTSIRRC